VNRAKRIADAVNPLYEDEVQIMAENTPGTAQGTSDAVRSLSPDFYCDPDGAVVLKGQLIPGANLAQAIVVRLRADLAGDQELRTRFESDPRSVLAERGLVRDVQDEVMAAEGVPIPQGLCTVSCIISVVVGSDRRLKRDIVPVDCARSA
jgi:hypothetical protein